MRIHSLATLLSATLLATFANANPAYLSGVDESQSDIRSRFIQNHADEKATQLDKKTFDASVQKQIQAIFGKKTTLTEAEFLKISSQQIDADFNKAREGQIRQTTVRFQSIDSNKDGFINLHEFQNIGLKSFERYDNNKDGVISLEDDQKAVETEAQEKEGEALTPRLRSILAMPTTHNAQGFLALYAEGKDKLTLADYLKTREQQYQRSDTNNDGKVDAKEYEAEFLTRVDVELAKAKAAHNHVAKARFNLIDQNADGKINVNDFLKFSQNHFAYWDTNKDGKVTLQEDLPQ